MASPIVLDDFLCEPKRMILDDLVKKTCEGDSSKAIVASSGSWRMWPFPFKRSRSLAVQPDLNNTRSSDVENGPESAPGMGGDKTELKPKVTKKKIRILTPTSEQLTSLNLKEGRNTVTFTFSTGMLGKQQVILLHFMNRMLSSSWSFLSFSISFSIIFSFPFLFLSCMCAYSNGFTKNRWMLESICGSGTLE